jgi:hypothetical protein
LQLARTITHELRQVLQVVSCSDTEPSNKIFGCSLEIAVRVIYWGVVIFRSAKVRVARNSLGAVELAEALLGL